MKRLYQRGRLWKDSLDSDTCQSKRELEGAPAAADPAFAKQMRFRRRRTVPYLWIVITDELAGDKYATCRALRDKADEVDLRRVIEDGDRGEDDILREHYRAFLTFLAEKNPDNIQ